MDSADPGPHYTCRGKREMGRAFCAMDCPHHPPSPIFHTARVKDPGDVPPSDPRVIDVAILDMNHGWPNLGHDSLVRALQEAACDIEPVLVQGGMSVRGISFEVRNRNVLPEDPGGRFALYLGTGGPGHLDPARNDGVFEGSQGIREDATWEPRLFRLFDRIQGSEETALLAVCHTFGVMCRWRGVAQPVLRPASKGGKSTGVLENVLTAHAADHPWFRGLAEAAADGRIPIIDNRLYDLIPTNGLSGVLPIGFETLGVGGPAGDAVTMLEFARDRSGVMPRVFGVNHHPEIVDRRRQLEILEQKRKRGDVSETWYQERLDILTAAYPDGDTRLHRTSDFTLLAPLRFHLYRQVRQRAEALGFATPLHEDVVPDRLGLRPADTVPA